jgi:hypothetical protein
MGTPRKPSTTARGERGHDDPEPTQDPVRQRSGQGRNTVTTSAAAAATAASDLAVDHRPGVPVAGLEPGLGVIPRALEIVDTGGRAALVTGGGPVQVSWVITRRLERSPSGGPGRRVHPRPEPPPDRRSAGTAADASCSSIEVPPEVTGPGGDEQDRRDGDGLPEPPQRSST